MGIEVTQVDRDRLLEILALWDVGRKQEALEQVARHRQSSVASLTDAPDADRIATSICRSVAEIPDRSSPDDQPDMMLVTADELHTIVTCALETEREALTTPPAKDDAGRLQAIDDIAAERHRQVEKEGYDPAHDDEHDRDLALPRAAACYALAGTGGNGPFWINPGLVPQQVWPYRWEWKPYDRRRNLVRAGALIVAEIERIDRSALSPQSDEGENGND